MFETPLVLLQLFLIFFGKNIISILFSAIMIQRSRRKGGTRLLVAIWNSRENRKEGNMRPTSRSIIGEIVIEMDTFDSSLVNDENSMIFIIKEM